MPVFKVLRRVDAFVEYIALIDASDAAEAAEFAAEDEGAYEWHRDGEVEFDDRQFVTLDGDGCEIDETRQGDV